MNTIIFFIPFTVYVLFIFYKLFKSIKNKEADDALKFSTGSKDYTSRIIFYTILGTMIGPGFSYGAVDKFYDYGFFYTIFFLLAVIQFWLFGHFFAGRIKNVSSNSETVGDILGSAYGKRTQLITGILSTFFSIALVGLLGMAGGKVLSSVIPQLSVEMATLVIVGFVALYSFYGGIATVIKTDKIQFYLIVAFLIIGLIACVIQFFSNTTPIEVTNFVFNTKDMPVKEMIAIGIAFFLGEAFIPVYSIRGIISKDANNAKRAFKKSAWFGFFWFILLTVIGILAHCVEHNKELSYLSLIFNSFHGIGGELLIGIAITGMIAVVMSTLDSILNAAGVSFRKDIVEQVFTINKEQELSYSRLAIVLISILGIFITMFFSDIVDLLIWAYTIWVPAIVFPLAYYLIKGKVNNKNSGFMGALFGILGWLLFQFFIPCWMPAILAGLLLNVIVVLLIEKYGKKDK